MQKSGWVLTARALFVMTFLTLIFAQTRFAPQTGLAASIARWLSLASLAAIVTVKPRWSGFTRQTASYDALLAMFIVLAGVSVGYSIDPGLTIARAATLVLAYFAVWWTVWALADVVGPDMIIDSMLYSVTVVFAIGLLVTRGAGHTTIVSPLYEAGLDTRYSGALDNPNAVGLIGLIFLPLASSLLARKKSFLAFSVFALIAGSVALSGSRTGFIAGLVGLVYFTIRRHSWTGTLGVATVGLVMILAFPDFKSSGSFKSNLGLAHLVRVESYATGGGRIEAWQTAIPLIRERIAFGHGFGTEDLIFRGRRFQVHKGAYIHNSFLGLAFQLGLIGAILFFVPLIYLGLRPISGQSNPPPQVFALEAVVVAGLVSCMFESWIYSIGNMFAFPFWVCVMLLVRYRRIRHNDAVHFKSQRTGAGDPASHTRREPVIHPRIANQSCVEPRGNALTRPRTV